MPKTNFAPWSAETAQGIKTDPVNSNISVKQEVIPAITVGTVNSVTGEWEGVLTSDENFTIDPTHEAVANGASVLSPQQAGHDYIDMDGFSILQIAIQVTNGGNYTLTATMGPDTNYFANLSPVRPDATLRGQGDWYASSDFENLSTGTESIGYANYWYLFTVINRLQGQKNLQYKITNASGSPSDIMFAYRRLV